MLNLIALMLHQHKEMPQIVSRLNTLAQIRLQHRAECGLASALSQPFGIAYRLTVCPLAKRNNRQTTLPAQPV